MACLMLNNRKKHLEPVLVLDLHMSKDQGSRREHWGCQHEDASTWDGDNDQDDDHLVAADHGQPALHPQHTDLGQGQDDPLQVQSSLHLLQ